MEKILDDSFLKSLPLDTLEGACLVIERIHKAWKKVRPGGVDAILSIYEELIESLSIFWTYCESNNLAIEQASLTGNTRLNISKLVSYFDQIDPRIRSWKEALNSQKEQALTINLLDKGKERFAAINGRLFCYEFSDDDLAKIQSYLDELWALISTSEELEEDHRKRLLRRLEQLQEEANKKLSDLDRFWGLVGDTGTVLEKLGDCAEKSAKILGIIAAITNIVFATQNEAHGLPYTRSHPLLLSSDNQQSPTR